MRIPCQVFARVRRAQIASILDVCVLSNTHRNILSYLAAGIDPNARNKDGDTAAHLAASHVVRTSRFNLGFLCKAHHTDVRVAEMGCPRRFAEVRCVAVHTE